MVFKNNIISTRTGFYAWPQFRILGLLAIAYGVYKLYTVGVSLFMLEFALILAGLWANLMTKGIQLDFTKKLYREYLAIVGIKTGKWIKLPDIDYVTVFNQQIVKQGGVQSLAYQDKFKVFVVRLIVDKDNYYDVASFKKTIEALDVGKICADNLSCKLLDYTGQEANWVDLKSSAD